ncbi:PAS domain-containing protein [Sphingomonas cannabina]|uniref:PAS domain-containing protein n=1 Tax=Sphingomonas cannabina TaxID=2899123 RepID=UPI001F3E8459|nr:PAS domain-containing protein [Sphingomonas cannabina]UIJ46691.1 PAS domain-containing protein [Sphingomonas cannabina]
MSLQLILTDPSTFVPIPLLAPLPGAWQCDLKDDSLTWSRSVFDLFGIPRDTPIDRRDIVEMYCEESRELLERLRSEAIASRGSFTFEARIRRLDGTMRWMRVTADTLCSNGRVTHLYGQKQDITHLVGGLC